MVPGEYNRASFLYIDHKTKLLKPQYLTVLPFDFGDL